MPEHTDDDALNPSEAVYKTALERMRAYWAGVRKRGSDEDAALETIPGYREWREQAFAQARLSEDNTARVAYPSEIEAEIAAVHSRFEDRIEQEAERGQMIATIALLDKSGVERLLAESWVEQDNLPVLNFLACSRNPCAVAPLIERLKRDVPDAPDLYTGNLFLKFIAACFPYSRQMQREIREMHRVVDRTKTISALGRLGSFQATAAIQPYLNDPSEKVREAAQKALTILDTSRGIES